MSAKVSVTIPVYNSERFIKETIESVLNQTYHDFEIIAVDDGSTDKSGEIIRSFNDKRITYIYQENKGVSVARNTGILRSNAKYVAFLDHDDIWLPQKLEKQIPLLDKNAEIALVYSDCYNVDAEGKVMKRTLEQIKPSAGKVFFELFLCNFIPCLTAVIRKTVFEKVGKFDPKFSIAEEYDLFLRIAKLFKIEYVDLPLAKYRIHETNFSRNIILGKQEEIEVLSKHLEENSEIKRILGKKIDERLAKLHFTLGRSYQLQRKFVESRKSFLSSIKYFRFNIKSYIYYLASLLNIVVPSREKIASALHGKRGI